MLETVKDDNNKICAYCEYSVTNRYWHFDDNGDYVLVHDIWVHPDKRGKGLIRYFIETIGNKHSQAKYMVRMRGEKGKPWQSFTRKKLKLGGYHG